MNNGRDRAISAATRAILRFAHKVIADAIELCPVEFGDLKASWQIDDVVEINGLLTILVGFNTNYAAAVHECLTNHISGKVINHPRGQAKYLETAMRANEPLLLQYVEEEWRKEGLL